jgi:uncharacterized protein (TIGR02145 family)
MKFLSTFILLFCILNTHTVFAQSVPLNIVDKNKEFIQVKTQEEIDRLFVNDGYFVFNSTTGCLNYFFKNKWFSLCGNCSPAPTIPTIDSVISFASKTLVYFKETGDTLSIINGTKKTTSLVSPLNVFIVGKEKEVKVVLHSCNKCGCADTTLVLPSNGKYVSKVETLQIGASSFKTRVIGNTRWLCEDYIAAKSTPIIKEKPQFISIEKNSCPVGWSIPSSTQWTELLSYFEENIQDIFQPATNENTSIALQKNGAYSVAEKEVVAVNEVGSYWCSDFKNGKQMLVNISGFGYMMPSENPLLVALPLRCIKNEK